MQSRWEYALHLVPLTGLLKEPIKRVEMTFMRLIFGRRFARQLPRCRAACRIRKVEDRRRMLKMKMVQRVQRLLETLSQEPPLSQESIASLRGVSLFGSARNVNTKETRSPLNRTYRRLKCNGWRKKRVDYRREDLCRVQPVWGINTRLSSSYRPKSFAS